MSQFGRMERNPGTMFAFYFVRLRHSIGTLAREGQDGFLLHNLEKPGRMRSSESSDRKTPRPEPEKFRTRRTLSQTET